MTVPKLVQITELRNIDLGEWSGSGGLQDEQSLCVWSSTGGYSLTGTSENAAAEQFRMVNSGGQTAVYEVYWNDGSGYRPLHNNETLTNLTATQEHKCAAEGSLRPNLRVRVTDQVLNATASGNYSDQLRFTVIAE